MTKQEAINNIINRYYFRSIEIKSKSKNKIIFETNSNIKTTPQLDSIRLIITKEGVKKQLKEFSNFSDRHLTPEEEVYFEKIIPILFKEGE